MEVSLEEISTPKNAKAKSVKQAKKPMFKFKQNSVSNHTPQIAIPEMPQNKFHDIPAELRRNIKPTIFRVMSMPAKEKAPILHAKLTMSEYMNKYIDSYLYIDNIKYINDHAKFGLCYLFNFIESKFYSPIIINNEHNNNNRSRDEPTNNQQHSNTDG